MSNPYTAYCGVLYMHHAKYFQLSRFCSFVYPLPFTCLDNLDSTILQNRMTLKNIFSLTKLQIHIFRWQHLSGSTLTNRMIITKIKMASTGYPLEQVKV